jgi:hypothetical protein
MLTVCTQRPLPQELRGEWSTSAWEVVLPLQEYDQDLGMRTRAAIRKQLDRDLPRSDVLLHTGKAVTKACDLLRLTSYPRLCTQAVLAPPLEWLLEADLVAHELPRKEPMRVRIDPLGGVSVVKRLGVKDAHASLGTVLLQVTTHKDDCVVVSVTPQSS